MSKLPAMTHRMTAILGLTFVLAVSSLNGLSRPALAGQAGDCYPDWSEAAAIVAREGLAPVETVTQRARPKDGGEIIKVTLCLAGERYVYRLLIRLPGGQHRQAVVDAKTPTQP